MADRGILCFKLALGLEERGNQVQEEAYQIRGSWNRSQPTGYKVVRVRCKDGRPDGSHENFITGFLVSGQSAGRGCRTLALPQNRKQATRNNADATRR